MCAAIAAASVWLSGWLSVRWRGQLAARLHRRYCAAATATAAAAAERPARALPPAIDNPDQRMTADLAAMCDGLASALRLAAGVPFRVCFYSWLAAGYVGWRGVAAAAAFFWVAAAGQRLAAVPLARRVFFQEQKEGDLRFAHLRLRQYAPEVAAWRGGGAELEALDGALTGVLRNQRRVMAWRAALTGATRLTDYSGALLNYILVAAVVFYGSGGGGGGSGGEIAQFVSNASFFTLTLIYTFTEVLDLAEQLATLAALTARVCGLQEALDSGGGKAGEEESSNRRRGGAPGWDPLQPGKELQPSGKQYY